MMDSKMTSRYPDELSSGTPVPVVAIDNFLTAVVHKADDVCRPPHCLLVIALIASLLALLTRFPHYETLPQIRQNVMNQAMSWQVRHPLTPIPEDLKNIRLNGPPASHVDKMELRLTLPLLGRVSGTGPWTVVVWGPISAVLLFYLLAFCVRDAIRDTTATAFFVVGLGATFFGIWGFNDFFYGDAVAFDLILLALCCLRRPWLSIVCFLGASFCDERSVLAAPLLLLYVIVQHSQPGDRKRRNQLLFAFAATIAMWLALRWWLSATFHLSTGTSMVATWEIVHGHLTDRQTYLSFVGLFRASWIIPALAVRRLIQQEKYVRTVLLMAAFGIVAVPALLIVDFNRGLCYVFLVFLLSLRLLWHDAEAPKKYLALMLLANILMSPPSKTVLRLLAH